MEDLINFALLEALKKGDVAAARELVHQGYLDILDLCDLYYYAYGDENPYEVQLGHWSNLTPILERNRKEIINLLIKFGIDDVDYLLLEYVYRSKDTQFAKEQVTYIIDNRNEGQEKMKMIQFIFRELVFLRSNHGTLETDIIKLLLSRGLDIEDFIENTDFFMDGDSFTLLQCSIWNCSFYFVRENFNFAIKLIQLIGFSPC